MSIIISNMLNNTTTNKTITTKLSSPNALSINTNSLNCNNGTAMTTKSSINNNRNNNKNNDNNNNIVKNNNLRINYKSKLRNMSLRPMKIDQQGNYNHQRGHNHQNNDDKELHEEEEDNEGDEEEEDDDEFDENDCRRVKPQFSTASGGEDHDTAITNTRNKLLFPGYVPVAFKRWDQASRPRFWCLCMITSPWFERVSMMVILFNCITLGMYQPCTDTPDCSSTRCILLTYVDHLIHVFFVVEMIIKMIAMGFYGKDTYLAETWNRLDFFIVVAGTLEYVVATENLSLSAIRTFRVLRPLRAINRVPSMRILVMLLLDTLPMLGNVLLLCFFVFFIFGIVGVQLWKGVLRNRCFFDFNRTLMGDIIDESFQNTYYKPDHTDSFICAEPHSSGMTTCAEIPPYINSSRICNGTIDLLRSPHYGRSLNETVCVNWNAYYTKCRPSYKNPFKGAISFDNIGFAWIAIFQIISLESWVTIMYYIQDAHSFWNWIYFVFLIVIGSFFMINLCLVVIATQFSETKKRETERMIAERRRFSRSTSTLLSDSEREPGSCWEEFLKYLAHLCRKAYKRARRHYRIWQQKRQLRATAMRLQKLQEQHQLTVGENAAASSANANLTCECTCHHDMTKEEQQSVEENKQQRCSVCNRAIDNSCGGLHDSQIFYSSVGVKVNAGAKQKSTLSIRPPSNGNADSAVVAVNEQQHQPLAQPTIDSNNHEFYCYSAKEALEDDEDEEDEEVECGDERGEEDDGDYYFANTVSESQRKQQIKYERRQRRYRRRSSQRARAAKKASYHKRLCCYTCCCCCAEQLVNSRLCLTLEWLSKGVRAFVDSAFFQRTILAAILINTICMGIEHHQQPALLTLIVEHSNYFFSCVFLVEMLLKICAYGLFDYIKNAYNLFDSVIVCISVWELIRHVLSSGQVTANTVDIEAASASSGVSVLRTFRLLRILKLVRFMPALRRQLVVMLKTIDNVATFFSLLCLFIFIFSILGMNLFGCKFCSQASDGTKLCERKNFDSLLWAIITVFQVLTQEDWNEVLYNGMDRTSAWASIYFVALMTFGNYVLFNLLVAILVEGFSTEDEPKKSLPERIKEDAIQAIVEEASHSRDHNTNNSQTPSVNGALQGRTRSNSTHSSQRHANKSTAGNRLSLSNNHSADLIAKKRFRVSQKSRVSSHNSFSLRGENISINIRPVTPPSPSSSTNQSANKPIFAKKQFQQHMQLPVITHTHPTPQHSPFNSTRASPLFANYGFLYDTKYLVSEQQQEQSPVGFRHPRKFSLDSAARFRRKLNLKVNPTTIAGSNRMNKSRSLSVKKNQQAAATLSLTPLYSGNESQLKEQQQPIMHLESLSNISSTSSKKKNKTRSIQPPLEIFISDTSSRQEHLTTPISQKEETRTPSPPPLPSFVVVTASKSNRQVVLHKSDFYKVDVAGGKNRRNENNDKKEQEREERKRKDQKKANGVFDDSDNVSIHIKCCLKLPKPSGFLVTKRDYSLYLFDKDNRIRLVCLYITNQKIFDYGILFFIALNCITLAMERPNIPPYSLERKILTNSNYFFSFIFTVEMCVKIIANGFYIGENAYLSSGWNKMDGFLVAISLVDAIVSLTARSSPKIFGILRVFRLLRTLRPLRVISRAPGLKLVVQTLLTSLRPIGNIVLICCTFFIIFGILGVQLFKGKFYRCMGEDIKAVKTKEDCLANPHNQWVNSQYNFDNLGQALMALFVLSSKDGWVQIMYYGIDAVGIDKQPVENYNEWMLLYFISFLLLVGFFVLNMFVGVVIENFHKVRAEQEKEEKARKAAKRAKKFEEKRRKMKEIPYYANYSQIRRFLHSICSSKYFDLIISGVIGLNVVTMSLEFYMMPNALDETLDVFNFVFTFIFLIEAIVRIVALGFHRYIKEKWNQLDLIIVILSIAGIFFDKLNTRAIPINPTIIRVMRVLRIARVLKLLKMAKGIRSLLDTVIQALPQVGNLGLLFFLLFFIFAILGVELFGKLNCESVFRACDGLSKHAHFHNFGMAFLTLFRIATGDNWNGIMKDTLKDNILCQEENAVHNPSAICLASVLAPIYFVIFVLMAQFVLVNVVVAVLMKHLDESNKMQADDAEMDEEIEKQLEVEARNNIYNEERLLFEENYDPENAKPLKKNNSLPPNFAFDLSPETRIRSMSQLIKHSNVPMLSNNHYTRHRSQKRFKQQERQNESNTEKKTTAAVGTSATATTKTAAISTSNILRRILRRTGHSSSTHCNTGANQPLISKNQPSSANAVAAVGVSSYSTVSEGEDDSKSNPKNHPHRLDRLSDRVENTVASSFSRSNDRSSSPNLSINNDIDTMSAILKSAHRNQQHHQRHSSSTNNDYIQQQQFHSSLTTRPPLTPDSNELNRHYVELREDAFQMSSEDLGTSKSHYSPKTSTRIRVIDETDTDF